ncbi:unnamed protein product [Danaus chrysippus]|uniref:(African queen) hypothetical protein n=1 Tax=Danaus chrysippus TaxID=151541 RepID=A0A8J2QH74_9NEOP|nr:unnamed protein product [Danaus chrysippus]
MHEIPECLKRRYKALDELIKDLSTYGATHPDLNASSEDPEIKLMCEFWNILKEDPDVNLKQAVQQRMGLNSNSSGLFGKGFECYMAGCCQKNSSKKQEKPEPPKPRTFLKKMALTNDPRRILEILEESDEDQSNSASDADVEDHLSERSNDSGIEQQVSDSDAESYSSSNLDLLTLQSQQNRRVVPVHSCKSGSEGARTPQKGLLTSKDSTRISSPKPEEPLHKVLCNLKEAASFEKKCQGKVNELLDNQKQLQEQITGLEQKERDGAQLLKQADCMWACMEESYKRKIAESLERQKGLLKQLKEVEASNKKWRNNKKDLDFQLNNITKCHQEIVEQINEKTNDVKCIEMEIESFKNRIESDKKDLDIAQKSMINKKKASDGRLATIALQVTKLENVLKEEKKIKEAKEAEGREYIKEARNDLQKLCKVLLQKKLENEDMKAEKEALLLEIEMLKQTCDQCREKCKNKQESLIEEIKTIDKEIAEFKVRCLRCHQCVDTVDVRSLCTDCPRCLNERECLVDGDHCSPDHTMDCVCATVKQKFLDNVFDNMYTLLERQIKTGPGKAVAEAVMDCLKKSKNGKINDQTKKILQDFILTTVKKNLKLTIIGGAVKTRCEMDPETYKQLMLCLKEVKVTKPAKADKGTDSKKDPCKRWGGTSECNCPKGPKACVCIGKGLLPTGETQTCPPQSDNEDDANVISCPYRENGPCGIECAARAPVDVGREVAAWKPDACQGPSCQFRNMRAAQCVLGPEVLATISRQGFINSFDASSPRMSGKQATCKCSGTPTIPCVCHKDLRSQPRQNIIQEVLGRYTDVTPIEKVVSVDGNSIRETEGNIKARDASVDDTYYNKSIQLCNCSCNSMISVSEQVTAKYNHIEKGQIIKTDVNNNCKNELIHSLPKNDTVKSSCQPIQSRGEEINGAGKRSSIRLHVYVAQENICKEVNELMKNVIAFDGTIKSNNLCEWVSLNSFIKEVTALTQITPDANSEQLNANLSGMCDQSCAVVEKFLDSRDNQESNKHITFKNMNIENTQNEPTKYVQVDVRDNNNRTESSSILKSNGNNLKIALNQKLIALLESKMEEKKILPLKFKNGENGELLVDFQTDDSMSEGEARILAKRSPSGNIYLEIEKNEEINKQRSNGYANSTNSNTKDGKEDSLERDINCANKIFKVKVIGTPELNEKEELFALKSTRSGNFEIVLDKEFEKWYKATVKNHEGEDDEYYMRLKSTDSGNYILNLEDNSESTLHSKNALLVKSDSGNIKVIVNDAAKKSPIKKESFSKSILSPKTFKDLLQKLPSSSKEHQTENIKKSHLRPQKSISDSGLYGRTKFNLQNEQYFPSDKTPVLNMTSSGEFTVTLNKESKKSFINNLKKYLSNSSKGLVPIRRSVSGVIYVDLSSSNNLSNYGTVKITPSGNIYITLDEQLGFAKEVFGNNGNRKMSGEKQSSENEQMSSNKESDSKKCQNCDKSIRCDCKKMRDKANNWSSKRSVDGSSETHPSKSKKGDIKQIFRNICVKKTEKKNNKSNSKQIISKANNLSEKKAPHIVIKPYECQPTIINNSKENAYSVCPYHINRYNKVSNEILEVSGPCRNSKNTKEENLSAIKEEKPLQSDRKAFDWDSLEYLPPQLPPFLTRFKFI